MKKSRYIFLVICCIYLGIGILSYNQLISINESTLLGLSLSALLISLSDTCNGIIQLRIWYNSYGFTTKTTLNFLKEKIDNNAPQRESHVSIEGMARAIQELHPQYSKARHPASYSKNMINALLYKCSMGCFILALCVFFAISYLPVYVENSLTQLLTTFAFATASFNLYISEVIIEFQQKDQNFWNNMYPIIITTYPDLEERYLFVWGYLPKHTRNAEDSENGQT